MAAGLRPAALVLALAEPGIGARRGDPFPSRGRDRRPDGRGAVPGRSVGGGAARLRQRAADSRADPRDLGLGSGRSVVPGRPLRRPHDAAQPRLYLRRGAHPGPRHRSQRGDVRVAVPAVPAGAAEHCGSGWHSPCVRAAAGLRWASLDRERDGMERVHGPPRRHRPLRRRRGQHLSAGHAVRTGPGGRESPRLPGHRRALRAARGSSRAREADRPRGRRPRGDAGRGDRRRLRAAAVRACPRGPRRNRQLRRCHLRNRRGAAARLLRSRSECGRRLAAASDRCAGQPRRCLEALPEWLLSHAVRASRAWRDGESRRRRRDRRPARVARRLADRRPPGH